MRCATSSSRGCGTTAPTLVPLYEQIYSKGAYASGDLRREHSALVKYRSRRRRRGIKRAGETPADHSEVHRQRSSSRRAARKGDGSNSPSPFQLSAVYRDRPLDRGPGTSDASPSRGGLERLAVLVPGRLLGGLALGCRAAAVCDGPWSAWPPCACRATSRLATGRGPLGRLALCRATSRLATGRGPLGGLALCGRRAVLRRAVVRLAALRFAGRRAVLRLAGLALRCRTTRCLATSRRALGGLALRCRTTRRLALGSTALRCRTTRCLALGSTALRCRTTRCLATRRRLLARSLSPGWGHKSLSRPVDGDSQRLLRHTSDRNARGNLFCI